MLDGGGGGGSSSPRTSWFSYDLPTMWSIVNGQDTDKLWDQAAAWTNTRDLSSMHKFNLETYREQLAEVWPPEQSEASRAYIAELDKLIASVQETYDAANSNYDAISGMARAVADAKRQLQPLFEEYQSNQQAMAEYNQLVESNEAMGQAGMMTTTVGDPPVRDGRQEELTNRARSIMYSIGSEVSVAAAALKPPKPYVPPRPGIDPPEPGSGADGTGGGTTLVPPVIPPVRPAPSPTPSSPGSPPAPPAPPTSPPPPAPPGIGEGPILGGTPTPTPAPPPPTLTPTPGPGPGPGPVPPGGPPIIGPTPPRYGPNPGPPPKATLPGTGLITAPGGPGPKPVGPVAGNAGPRPMPPGGLIGGPPGAGLTRPGDTRSVSRVNPPGAVIGQPGAAARPGGPVGSPASSGRPANGRGGGSHTSGLYAPPARASQRPDGKEPPKQHWDPDNPWETEEGVAPVVLPPAEPRRHDPGPAIGQGR